MRALILAVIATLLIAPVSARAAESHVWIINHSLKDVWVTAFTNECKFPIYGVETKDKPSRPVTCVGGSTARHIVHEWCVPYNSTSNWNAVNKQGFHTGLTVVHVLVTQNHNCGRPIIKDWTMTFPPSTGSQSVTQQYVIDARPPEYPAHGDNTYTIHVRP